ncbi:fic family protein [Firmicutes bacterium CAG:646]|nr:fic family protein [Firmicutes bacterium CAG:646]
MEKDPFKEYLRESEPDKYLLDIAIQNIEGEITMKEAQSLIDSYYEERPEHLSDDERTEEADKVSSRIA